MAVNVDSRLFLWSKDFMDIVMEEPYSLMGYHIRFFKNDQGEQILLAPAYYLFFKVIDYDEEEMYY